MTKKKTNKSQPEAPTPRSSWETYGAVSVFMAIAVIYLLTLKRTVEGGDSGEIIVAAYTMGIAHPPGYPLYTILGKIFTFIPFGSVALKLNLFSAVCNWFACLGLYYTSCLLFKRKAMGLIAVAIFAFYPYVWRYSLVAEVFALNNLLCAWLLWLFTDHILRREDKRNLYLGALTIGLGMSHHHTILFISLPLVLSLIWYEGKKLLDLKVIVKLIGFGLLGLLPYLYLPLAASFHPANIWGDHTNLSGILSHFLREDYGTFSLAVDGETRFLESLVYYFYKTSLNLGWIGGLFFAAGLLPWRKNQLGDQKVRYAFASLAISFLFYIVIFHYLSNITQFLDPKNDLGPMYFEILLRFWILPHLLFSVIVAAGILKIVTYAKPNQQVNISLSVAALACVGLVTFHYHTEDQSHLSFVDKQARYTLDALPENSIVFISGDTLTNSIRYLQFGEGYRKDVTVLNRQMLKREWMNPIIGSNFPHIKIPGSHFGYTGYHFLDLFEANYGDRPIFISQIKETDDYEMQDTGWKEHFDLWPYIQVEKLVYKSGNLPDSFKTKLKTFLPNLEKLAKEKPSSPAGSWEMIAWRSFWDVHHNYARRLILEAMTDGNDRDKLEEAVLVMERILKTCDSPKPQYYKDLGLAYSKMTLYDSKYNALTKEMWQIYLTRPIANDKDNTEIKRIVDNL